YEKIQFPDFDNIYWNDRLNVKVELVAIARRTVSPVFVCLKRHANERSDWIGKFLGQLVGLIGFSRGFGHRGQAKILMCLKRQAEPSPLKRLASFVAVCTDVSFGCPNPWNH